MPTDHSYIEAALPCFPRATSIGIDSCGLIHLTDRVLIVSAPVSHIVVHSGSLQALDVSSNIVCYSIDIATPMLKHLEIHIQPDTDLSVSVSAPMVEKVEWNCSFTEFALVFGFWHLRRIMVSGRRPIHALHLALSVPDQFDDELDFAQEMDFAQAMEKLPVTDFSILKLTLEPHGHVFGALVLHLFGLHPICAVMKRLIVDIPGWPEGRQACPENCPCDEPKNWRCQSISLTCLEEVLIYGFTGEDHEHDFLELIFRSSPMLNRVALKLVPGFRGCIKEIYDIFLANPSVKVCVYASNGGLVQRPSMFLS